MPALIKPPSTAAEPVTEILHGVPITDPFRWLEDQNSERTRQWIEEQTRYARTYLDGLPGRERIRERIREFLAVETFDSVMKAGNRYFFRKRLAHDEQPSLYMRAGADGEDQLLLDPAHFKTGKYTAVKPLRTSSDGRLLLYEIKQGGERTGSFALLDIERRETLHDVLPHGYLRGFAFAPDGKSFYYVHESAETTRPFARIARHHVVGTSFREDRDVFSAGNDERLRLCLISDEKRLGFLVFKFLEQVRTDFYLTDFEKNGPPEHVLADADYRFGPMLASGRVLAITNRNAPNSRIVELRLLKEGGAEWLDVIPESEDRISRWFAIGGRIVLSYIRPTETKVCVFDFSGTKLGEMPTRCDETVRVTAHSPEGDELLVETESFTQPVRIFRYQMNTRRRTLLAKRAVPFNSAGYIHTRVSYPSRDGTRVPMFLLGRRDVLEGGSHPVIMTAYGGYGVSMTPQFSVFVAFLIERGCLFALPNIRGGSEFGVDWHNQAKRGNRQRAYDDFLCAAEWLIETGRTTSEKLAIFGGSNSGLLVCAALTQRPDLFRAVVSIAPMLDMLRYHLFDNAHVWRSEYGTADDPDDFSVLKSYSPYHRVRDGLAYPATMIVSGDADRNSNPLHARKMTARLQAANASGSPVILDYSWFRGHSPVLPLSERIEALTDRMAFLSDQLQLPV